MHYTCIAWVIIVGLLLATTAAVAVLLWLLHQKGFLDPVYDWWREDVFRLEPRDRGHPSPRHKKGHRHGDHTHRHHAHHRRKNGPSHHHHRVLHRRGEQQPDAAVAEGHGHQHDAALGVKHGELGHKHRHGKAVAAALHWDVTEDSAEYWERIGGATTGTTRTGSTTASATTRCRCKKIAE
uniref:HAP2 n=1 Tax=Arundo donax TaxID=35708 RepID=A0A0A9A5U3_ARUDO